MEFLKGKNGYYMNQNSQPLSEELKEAFDAIKQAAISLGTCTLSKHISVGTFPKFLYMFSNKNTYKLYSVFMEHY